MKINVFFFGNMAFFSPISVEYSRLNFNEENEPALRWAAKIVNWSAHLSQTKAETYRRPFNLGRSGR